MRDERRWETRGLQTAAALALRKGSVHCMKKGNEGMLQPFNIHENHNSVALHNLQALKSAPLY